jgi:hypothetical protein
MLTDTLTSLLSTTLLSNCNYLQWVFVATCAFKLVALCLLCLKAYEPFRLIVTNNKFVQAAVQSEKKSGTPSATPTGSPRAASGKGKVVSNNRLTSSGKAGPKVHANLAATT